MPALKFILCPDHGPLPWRGDFVCSACGVVYLQPDEGLGPMPDNCSSCRGRLLPPDAGKGEFSARPCCRPCAVAQAFAGGGRTPPTG